MPTLSRILAPIDFSPSSRAALEYALFLAARTGAALEVLHVWEPAGYVGPGSLALLPVAAGQPGWEQTRADVQREVEALIGRSGDRPASLSVRVEAGQPDDAVISAAKAVQADLIVMGTHGRTGLARLLLGSIAESVLRRATCPVLTVRVPSLRSGPSGPAV